MIVAVSDARRSQRSAAVKTAIATFGPALLTNGVNRTPANVAARYTTPIAATVTIGHFRRTIRGALARIPNPATAAGDPIRAAAPIRTGSVKAAKQPAATRKSIA